MRTLTLFAAATLAARATVPAAAQQVRPMQTLVARTSIVLVPRVNIEIDKAAPQHGQVTYGGTAVWLPRRPVVAELAFQQHMLSAGSTTFEIGGGWRRRETIADEEVSVVTGGWRTRDSVFTQYVNGTTAVRRFDMLRAGYTSLSYMPDGGPKSPGMSALYVGVSRNRLVNTGSGMTNLRVLQRTGIDLLIGSAPAGAYSGSGIGVRGYVSRDVGGIIGWSMELGSRPGFGAYGLATIDLYFMFTDVAR